MLQTSNVIKGKAVLIEPRDFETKYPNALSHLRKHEVILREREKGRFNNEYWYQYRRNQAISVLEQPKIITPEVCFGGSMTFDEENYYHNSKCHTLLLKQNSGYTYKSVLPILNSKLFWFYLSHTGNVLRGGYIGVKRKVMEPFGIPEPNKIDVKLMANYSDTMLNVNGAFQNSIEKLINYIERSYGLVRISKKLQAWYELDFSNFIQELNKAIKTTGGNILSKVDEMEWMDLFESKKKEAQDLKAEIERTEKEIDQMVYELYGLSEEEIKIVEEA
jgi:hypothetical protein